MAERLVLAESELILADEPGRLSAFGWRGLKQLSIDAFGALGSAAVDIFPVSARLHRSELGALDLWRGCPRRVGSLRLSD